MSSNTDVQSLMRHAADKTPPRAALGNAFEKAKKSLFSPFFASQYVRSPKSDW
jgi:hypothetical protein